MTTLISTIRTYAPATHNETEFQITVYSGANGIMWVNTRDFYDALEFRKSDVDSQIKKTIDTLKLEEGRDYLMSEGNDPIVDSPKYIWTLSVALEASKRIDTDKAEAAVKFFEGVTICETNVFQHLCFDMLVRQPVFPLAHVAYVLYQNLYNDGCVDDKILVKMLKKDRVLTKTLRPVKGHESFFVIIKGTTCVTPAGFVWIMRKYLGATINESLEELLNNLQYASRLVSASLIEDNRVGHFPPGVIKEAKPEEGETNEREDICVDGRDEGDNH